MALFLLVPGAWHGAWCWDNLAPLLQKSGHKVITPDLVSVPAGANPLPIWTQQIADLIKTAAEPPILLGHSRGGMVISEAAAQRPQHISSLIYLSGFFLTKGESMQSAMARPEAGGEPDYLRPARGRCLSISPEASIPLFYHLAPSALAQHAASQLRPEPVGTFSAPSTTHAAQLSGLSRFYIECSEDRIVPLALQRVMQKSINCKNVFTLASDHSPFISQPEALAALLNQIAPRSLQTQQTT